MPLATSSTEQLWFLNTLHTVHVRHDEGEDGISVMESIAPHGDSPRSTSTRPRTRSFTCSKASSACAPATLR
jgi:hypothetical protein